MSGRVKRSIRLTWKRQKSKLWGHFPTVKLASTLLHRSSSHVPDTGGFGTPFEGYGCTMTAQKVLLWKTASLFLPTCNLDRLRDGIHHTHYVYGLCAQREDYACAIMPRAYTKCLSCVISVMRTCVTESSIQPQHCCAVTLSKVACALQGSCDCNTRSCSCI
jgi:hypothetical protein